ncbi:MAG TPA: hypothetical protein VKT28_22610 [Puia sp.]|nr:hypothetical protein [Puia sp.]
MKARKMNIANFKDKLNREQMTHVKGMDSLSPKYTTAKKFLHVVRG